MTELEHSGFTTIVASRSLSCFREQLEYVTTRA